MVPAPPSPRLAGPLVLPGHGGPGDVEVKQEGKPSFKQNLHVIGIAQQDVEVKESRPLNLNLSNMKEADGRRRGQGGGKGVA